MKIVTAYSEDYKPMKDNLVASANHEVIAYKIGNLKDNKRFIKQCHYKIGFIREALRKYNEDVVWIDCDCIVRDLDNPLAGCDVAVTLRRPSDPKDMYYHYSGLLNAGVIFFANNDAARFFVDYWEGKLNESEYKTDQEALNLACGISEFTRPGDVLYANGACVRVLNCDEYNFFYFPEDPKDAKVLHFKGDVRHYMQEYEVKPW